MRLVRSLRFRPALELGLRFPCTNAPPYDRVPLTSSNAPLHARWDLATIVARVRRSRSRLS
eukprot:2272715-Pleurochrysis_carterae.AAC.2